MKSPSWQGVVPSRVTTGPARAPQPYQYPPQAREPMRCFTCGNIGHMARACPNKMSAQPSHMLAEVVSSTQPILRNHYDNNTVKQNVMEVSSAPVAYMECHSVNT